MRFPNKRWMLIQGRFNQGALFNLLGLMLCHIKPVVVLIRFFKPIKALLFGTKCVFKHQYLQMSQTQTKQNIGNVHPLKE